MKGRIQKIVFDCTQGFFENSDYDNIHPIDENLRLIGSSSVLDSMGLVSLIVEIEEAVNDEFDTEIVLANEKAMSARTSPFLNLGKLITFIEEEIKLTIDE